MVDYGYGFDYLEPKLSNTMFDMLTGFIFKFDEKSETWIASNLNLENTIVSTKTYYNSDSNSWYYLDDDSGRFYLVSQSKNTNSLCRYDSFKKIFFEFDVKSEKWLECQTGMCEEYQNSQQNLYFDIEYSEWFLFDKKSNLFKNFQYYPLGYVTKGEILRMSRFDENSGIFYIFDESDLF